MSATADMRAGRGDANAPPVCERRRAWQKPRVQLTEVQISCRTPTPCALMSTPSMPANGRGPKNLFDPAANIRGLLGWGGLHVAMPIWRELHDSMKMHLAIERLVQDSDTVVAL
jgi:hypothetical protein